MHRSSVQDGKPCSRDPLATVAKHHWWWLHNFVFTKVLDAAKYKGAFQNKVPLPGASRRIFMFVRDKSFAQVPR